MIGFLIPFCGNSDICGKSRKGLWALSFVTVQAHVVPGNCTELSCRAWYGEWIASRGPVHSCSLLELSPTMSTSLGRGGWESVWPGAESSLLGRPTPAGTRPTSCWPSPFAGALLASAKPSPNQQNFPGHHRLGEMMNGGRFKLLPFIVICDTRSVYQ